MEGIINELYTLDVRKNIKKFDEYILVDLFNNVNKSQDVFTIFTLETQKEINRKILSIIANEQSLFDMGSHIFFDLNTIIADIFVLLPINLNKKEYIFPILYLFTDGRQILKFSYPFKDKDISPLFTISPIIEEYSYLIPEKGKTFIKKNGHCTPEKNIEIIDAINSYMSDFSIILDYDGLVQNYQIVVVTKVDSKHIINKKVETKLYSISKSPFSGEINTKKMQDDSNTLNETMLLFSNPIRSVITLKNKIQNESSQFDVPIDIQILGNIQTIIHVILLRRFADLIYSKEAVIKNNLLNAKKKKQRYLINENMIMFSNYYSGVECHQWMNSRINTIEKQKLLDEIDSLNAEITSIEIENKLNKFEILLAMLGVILSVLFSYDPIKSVADYFKITHLHFPIYLVFNISVIFVLYKTYKKLD